MHFGIIGLPQCGKTRLFSALTDTSPELSRPHTGRKPGQLSTVKVPDPRLDDLHNLYPMTKKVHATIEYSDVIGLSKGSTQRRGFQEQFLGNLRNADALLCVLRSFENASVPHPEGETDPKRDLAIIEGEFLLSDMSILENRIARVSSDVKKVKDDRLKEELRLLERCLSSIESEMALRELDFSASEEKLVRGFQFLTAKPILIVLNVNENQVGEEQAIIEEFSQFASGRKKVVECISAELEAEIAQISEEERETFQKEMGIAEPALNKMVRNSYSLLGLISFFTVSDKEVRAWTIERGTPAQTAAGAVHSDMERGFIRAEVVDFETLSKLGSLSKCKEHGVLRLEGKDYKVKDGDVITFRFNV